MSRLLNENDQLTRENRAFQHLIDQMSAKYESMSCDANAGLCRENAELRKSIQNIECRVKQLENKKKELLKENGKLKVRLETASNDVSEVQTRIRNLETERNQIERELRSRCDGLRHRNEELIRENEILENQKGREVELLVEIRNLQDELDEARFSVNELLLGDEREIDGFSCGQLIDVIETQQQQLEDAEFTARRALQDRDEVRHENANLMREVKVIEIATKAQITEFGQIVDGLNIKLKAADTTGARLLMKVKSLETERTDLKMELEKCKVDLVRYKSRFGEQSEEIVTSQAPVPEH